MEVWGKGWVVCISRPFGSFSDFILISLTSMWNKLLPSLPYLHDKKCAKNVPNG